MKTGKSTLAFNMPKPLFLAFEKGYNTLPGVMPQDITSWSEMRQAYKQLKKPEVKALYDSIIIDTIDVASDMCTKYICDQKNIESLGDLGYGKGWTAFKNEFNEIFRGLTQLGYAVVFLGHDKIVTDEDGNVLAVRPALPTSVRTVIAGMADIYGYAHQKKVNEMSVLTLRDSSGKIECGCRFKYILPEIVTNYHALVDTLTDAIDKEAAEYGNQFVTDEKMAPLIVKPEYDFKAMMTEFKTYVDTLMSRDSETYALQIPTVVEKYLGKGKKVSECTPTQCEQLELILIDLKELVDKNQ